MPSNPKRSNSIWWGPPKKFSTNIEERKISWLELFYDLVYVIVISRATHHLSGHYGAEGLLDFFLLFMIIFWGWLNGSMYFDLHGTSGIRSRLMTLWQMMAVAALAAALDSSHSLFNYRTVYALLFLELYITYLWWSVGIYDKAHRKLNMPYTLCYLAAAILIIATLWVDIRYQRALLGMAILLNYLPPFLTNIILRRQQRGMTLSSSMVERLGLLTIIVFGEGILGVISGMSKVSDFTTRTWIYFGLGILIVFALWWIFFALIADRPLQKGKVKWQLLPMLYIPALAALGITGAAFSDIPGTFAHHVDSHSEIAVRSILGISISIFLVSIVVISTLLNYPESYSRSKKVLQPIIVFAAIVILLVTLLLKHLDWVYYLLIVFGILVVLIIFLTRMWFFIEMKRRENPEE